MQIRRGQFSNLLLAAILMIAIGQVCSAQSNTHLKGRIADISGGAIANAKIVADNLSGKFEAMTNEKGEFAFELPAGRYQISTVKMPGFAPYKEAELILNPDQSKYLTITLQVNLTGAECILTFTGQVERTKKKVIPQKLNKNRRSISIAPKRTKSVR